MLPNAYFVAKFRFDTAENEPAKNLQNFRKMHFRPRPAAPAAGRGRRAARRSAATRPGAPVRTRAVRGVPNVADVASSLFFTTIDGVIQT